MSPAIQGLWGSQCDQMVPCKANRLYLLTLQVSRYRLLALQTRRCQEIQKTCSEYWTLTNKSLPGLSFVGDSGQCPLQQNAQFCWCKKPRWQKINYSSSYFRLIFISWYLTTWVHFMRGNVWYSIIAFINTKNTDIYIYKYLQRLARRIYKDYIQSTQSSSLHNAVKDETYML